MIHPEQQQQQPTCPLHTEEGSDMTLLVIFLHLDAHGMTLQMQQ